MKERDRARERDTERERTRETHDSERDQRPRERPDPPWVAGGSSRVRFSVKSGGIFSGAGRTRFSMVFLSSNTKILMVISCDPFDLF